MNSKKQDERCNKHSTSVKYSNYPKEFMETYNQMPHIRTQKAGDNERRLRTTLSLYRFCKSHSSHQLEFFCVNHDILCCKECTFDHHKDCLNIKPTEQESVGVMKSKEFSEFNDKLQDVLKILTGQEVKNEIPYIKEQSLGSSDISRSPTQHQRHAKMSITETVSSFIDKKITIAHKTELKDDLLCKVNELYELTKFVKESGSDIDAFLLIKSCKEDIDKLVEETKTKIHKPKNSKISIKQHKDTVLPFINKKSHAHDTLSVFKSDEFPMDKTKTFPPMETRRKSLNMSARIQTAKEQNQLPSFAFLHDIDLQETKMCSIYGMIVTENNFLLLCDSNFHRIIVCDENDNFHYKFEVRYDPWDIAVLTGTTAVVTTSIDEHMIQFIDIKRKCVVKETKSKHSDHAGIAAENDVILVGAEDKVKILDPKGKQIRTLTGMSGRCEYIHISKCGNIILVHGQKIYSITSEGNEVFTYSSPDLKLPGKPATDCYGNVYIPSMLSHKIQRLKADGINLDVILNENDGIHFPTAACFNRDFSKLYVANNSGNSVRVFKSET